MNNNELQLHVPFDENSGGVAHDTSGHHHDLTIVGGEWVKGRLSNALKFAGEGFTESVGYALDFSKDFTMTIWLKAERVQEYPTATWMIYNFEGENDFLYLDAKTPATDWTYLVIVQEGNKVKIYRNGDLVARETFPDDWGNPIGLCLMNNNPGEGGGYMTIDDLKIYDGVNNNAIKPPIINMDILYKIDGHNFRDYGVRVKDSTGMFDAPEIKPPVIVDWQDYHGDFVDLNDIRYKSKVIELDCWLYANSPEDFVQKCTNFINLFYGSGTKRLHFDNGSKVYVYEVYLSSGLKIEKKWRPSQMIGSFKLTLNEPQPIKRVISFIRTSYFTTASVTVDSPKLLTIYWGDGTKTDNVYGAVTKTHTYANDGQYYIIVAGVIEEISSFTTNGIIQNAANSFI